VADPEPSTTQEEHMLIAASTVAVTLLGVLYVILLFSLGFTAIRKGHWIMFIVGIFVPIFWIIGALMPPTQARSG
jgi:hypothetical protein